MHFTTAQALKQQELRNQEKLAKQKEIAEAVDERFEKEDGESLSESEYRVVDNYQGLQDQAAELGKVLGPKKVKEFNTQVLKPLWKEIRGIEKRAKKVREMYYEKAWKIMDPDGEPYSDGSGRWTGDAHNEAYGIIGSLVHGVVNSNLDAIARDRFLIPPKFLKK